MVRCPPVVGVRLENDTFDEVCEAMAAGRVHVSEHAYDEAVADDVSILDVIDATPRGELIEDYPDDPRGRSCLVLLRVGDQVVAHAVWAFDHGSGRAILVTVYRPDPARWSGDLRLRRPRK
jgi:hypothetical protein